MKENALRFQCLIADPSPELGDLIEFLIVSQLSGITCFKALTIEESLRILAKENIDILITEDSFSDGNVISILNRIKKTNPLTSVILCSGNYPEYNELFKGEATLPFHVVKPFFQKTLIKQIQKLIIEKYDNQPELMSEYVPVTLPLLALSPVLSSDLYIQLSPSKFLKVLLKGEVFTEIDHQHYNSKQIECLFIEKDKVDAFFEHALQEILAKQQVTKKVQDPCRDHDQIFLQTEILKTIQYISKKMGFTPELQQITLKSVEHVLDIISGNPDILNLFKKRFFKSPDSSLYLFNHSIALIGVSCFIAERLKWISHSTATKLAFAALFHDLSLEDPELAKIQHVDDFDKNPNIKFTAESKREWIEHPIRSANLVSEFQIIPPHVDLIIRQHHERPDGTGIPHELHHSMIAPLSAVMIVAHAIVMLWTEKPEASTQDFIHENGSLYESGTHFKKIIDAIRG